LVGILSHGWVGLSENEDDRGSISCGVGVVPDYHSVTSGVRGEKAIRGRVNGDLRIGGAEINARQTTCCHIGTPTSCGKIGLSKSGIRK